MFAMALTFAAITGTIGFRGVILNISCCLFEYFLYIFVLFFFHFIDFLSSASEASLLVEESEPELDGDGNDSEPVPFFLFLFFFCFLAGILAFVRFCVAALILSYYSIKSSFRR